MKARGFDQFSIEVKLPESYVGKGDEVWALPAWDKPIDYLVRYAKRQRRGRVWVTLPVPGTVHGIQREHRGVWVRVLAQYRVTPLPAGYIGRIDVAVQ